MATDQDLAAKAEAALKATTITYQAWLSNVKHGKYNPKDGSTTQWGIAFAALDQIGVTPPQPTNLGKGVATGRSGNSYSTSILADLAHFDVLLTDLNGTSAPQDLPGVFHYFYRDLCTSSSYDSSIPRATVVANNWYLKDNNGNPVQNEGYGGYILDISNPAMSSAWAQNAIKWAQQNGYQGIFGDDYDLAMSSLVSATPVGWDQNKWAAMLRQHVGIIAPLLKSAGLKFIPNVSTWGIGHPADEDGSADLAEYTLLQQLGVSGCLKEYWLEWGDGSNTLYTGSDWDNWRTLHQRCNQLGIDFIAVTYGNPDTNPNIYGRATHLLDRERSGSVLMSGVLSTMPPAPGVQSYGPKWCKDMGAPVGASSGNARSFANGSVSVDKNAGTATIT